MKTGKTLQELAMELQRQSEAKMDVVADTSNIHVNDTASALIVGDHTFDTIQENAHRQLGTFLDIPRKYYEKMHSAKSELLANNINTWLDESKARRMVRTLDGSAYWKT